MKYFIQLVHPILQHPFYTLFIIWIIVKYSDGKKILSDEKGLSSRRVVAMLAANCLFNNVSYCVHNGKVFDTTIGWTLVVLCLFCLGMVMFPEILQLISKLNDIKSGIITNKTTNYTEQTVKITEDVK